MVDLVGRVETIAHDFEEVCRRLGKKVDCVRLNMTEKADYRSVYGEAAKSRVAEVYRGDIETFGYGFEA